MRPDLHVELEKGKTWLAANCRVGKASRRQIGKEINNQLFFCQAIGIVATYRQRRYCDQAHYVLS